MHILSLVLFLLMQMAIGGCILYLVNKRYKTRFPIATSITISHIIGFGVFSTISTIMLIINKLELVIPLIVITAFMLILISKVNIKNYIKMCVSNRKYLMGILLIIFIFAWYCSNYSGFLWDGRSSWYIKTKAFFYENNFPNTLYLVTDNYPIIKYYPPWQSLYYAIASRYVGFFDESNIKIIQSIWFSLGFLAFYETIKGYYKTVSESAALKIASITTLLVIGNTNFLYWLFSGYMDITQGVFNTVFLIVILKLIENNNKGYLFLSLSLLAIGSLVKNEGTVFMVCGLIFITINYLIVSRKKIERLMLREIVVSLSPIIAYLIWITIRVMYNFKVDIIESATTSWTNLPKYFAGINSFFTYYIKDLFNLKTYGVALLILTLGMIFTTLYCIKLLTGWRRRVGVEKSFILLFGTIILLHIIYIWSHITHPDGIDMFYKLSFLRLVNHLIPIDLILIAYSGKLFLSNQRKKI